jgi:PAS domain S-box-containing protein
VLARLYDGLPIGIAIFDAAMCLRRWNAAWADYVRRYTPAYAARIQSGAALADLTPDSVDLPALFQRVLAGERVQRERLQRAAGGRVSRWDAALVPLLEDGVVVGVLDVVTDATERELAAHELAEQARLTALHAEEALRERETQYRDIFNSTSDGLIITDRETGVILAANPAVAAMHGYTLAEFVGLHRSAIIHPGSMPMLSEYVRTIQAGGSYRLQAIDVRKDGSSFHVEVQGSGFVYNRQPAILGVVRDITAEQTAYRQLEERVAERTRELTTLLDIAQSVTSTLDLQQLISVIFEQVNRVMETNSASILLRDGDVVTLLASRLAPETAGQRYTVQQMEPLWSILAERGIVTIDDVRGESELARRYRAVVGPQFLDAFSHVRSWLAAPLIVRDGVIGFMSVSWNDVGHFNDYHAELLRAIASHAAVAIENARLAERTRSLAVLQERQRLARELHDSVSQALFGIALGARTARTMLDREPAEAREPLDYVLQLAEAGLTEMRALIFELRPEALDSEGLTGVLEQQAAALRIRHGLEATVTLCHEPSAPLDVKEAVFRIAQEALNNIVKHARATHLRLDLACDARELTLDVRDDGRGFDPDGSFPGHLGLRTMRERAARLGGSVRIESIPAGGTRVVARVPLLPG